MGARYPGTRRYATEALALLEQTGRDELAARVMIGLAMAGNSEGDFHTSLELFQQAFIRAGPDHLASLAFGVEIFGLAHYWMGNLDTAIERNQHALALARQSSDTTTIARALANLGLALGGQGRYAEALQMLADAQKFAQEQGIDQWRARAIAMSGGLHLEVFDFAGAQALAEEARELGQSLRWPQAVVSGGIDLLLNFARRGEVGRTEALVARWPRLPPTRKAFMAGSGGSASRQHRARSPLLVASGKQQCAPPRKPSHKASSWVG